MKEITKYWIGAAFHLLLIALSVLFVLNSMIKESFQVLLLGLITIVPWLIWLMLHDVHKERRLDKVSKQFRRGYMKNSTTVKGSGQRHYLGERPKDLGKGEDPFVSLLYQKEVLRRGTANE